jgi:hypothetical protein
MDMDDMLDAQALRDSRETLTYTEINFASFESVHVDEFHA